MMKKNIIIMKNLETYENYSINENYLPKFNFSIKSFVKKKIENKIINMSEDEMKKFLDKIIKTTKSSRRNLWLFSLGGLIYTHFNLESYFPILLVLYFSLSFILETLEDATEDIKEEIEKILGDLENEINETKL